MGNTRRLAVLELVTPPDCRPSFRRTCGGERADFGSDYGGDWAEATRAANRYPARDGWVPAG